MSWKESKVRLLPPVPPAHHSQDRKPDIQDLFLLANQAAALKAAQVLPVPPDSQNNQTSVSVAETSHPHSGYIPPANARPLPPHPLQLPLHPVKVEPGNSVINLPPPPVTVTSSKQPQPHSSSQLPSNVTALLNQQNPLQRISADCAIMPPPPPPPPRTPTSPSTTSVSSTSGEDSEQSTDIGKITNDFGRKITPVKLKKNQTM